ncbi:LEA type 2 family protein [Neiella sp. HB171785]|uniref:LEA type 2 family protein n=1 Tax=Neiella litorisoli TaxID=2771431 RepID=A0A8J6QIR8_9GAMM|nr:LEA type 2 family protein [Neiella litorisoli]MBD1388841.1 LEA type 2 family protein [Neiella litorisoli]
MTTIGVRMAFNRFKVAFAVLLMLLTGCASLPPTDPPQVNLVGITPVVNDSSPSFILSVRVVNPNDRPLELVGAAYSLALNGYDLVAGATNDLPAVPAYGEAEFKLPAQLSLFDGIRLATSLLKSKPKQIDYEVNIKLDAGGLWPAIRFSEAGQISGEDLLGSKLNDQSL